MALMKQSRLFNPDAIQSILDDWPETFAEAKVIQQRLCEKILLQDQLSSVNYIAGVDAGVLNKGRQIRASVVILNATDATVVEQKSAVVDNVFPYVPGYLSFRELPAVLSAFLQIEQLPQLIMCDGQGIAHPRRFGIACHLGLITGIPSFGVAKSKLVGDYESPSLTRGSHKPLYYQQQKIGAVLCTRDNVKPVFVSPGHLINIDSAVHWTLTMGRGFKLPEPTRVADKLASRR
ncbi:endonuclease V [Pleionea mediterranea]|uniref:Endonuclease V n=2 Tax=Pleionea mediterranea TaxID=523701 RepID=A0A316FI53_9GAMM|nr:endonuclease V [Pleionea mediterranea]